jgi:hypothetical protein
MSVPTNGKVVLIDDHFEQALPLIEVLAKEGVAIRYYSGRGSNLPLNPINNVRLLFLDFKLEGMDFDNDPDNATQSLKHVVDRIIDENNGPYILACWSAASREIQRVVEALDIKPVCYFDLDKTYCLADRAKSFNRINTRLRNRIRTIGNYDLLLFWENLVNTSAGAVINGITGSIGNAQDLDSLLYSIAKADLGKLVVSANYKILARSILQVMNGLLGDSVENRLIDFKPSTKKSLAKSTNPRVQAIAKINSSILINQTNDNSFNPGNVYLSLQGKLRTISTKFLKERIDGKKAKSLINHKLSTQIPNWNRLSPNEREQRVISENKKYLETVIKDSKRIGIEVTPVCDHAQGTTTFHRFISGILIKKEYEAILSISKDEIAVYKIGPIFINRYSDIYYIVLDLKALSTSELGTLNNKRPLFRIRKELLVDIQHKVGSHLSRPGTYLLD